MWIIWPNGRMTLNFTTFVHKSMLCEIAIFTFAFTNTHIHVVYIVSSISSNQCDAFHPHKTHYFHFTQCEKLHKHQGIIIIVIVLKHLKQFDIYEIRYRNKHHINSVLMLPIVE